MGMSGHTPTLDSLKKKLDAGRSEAEIPYHRLMGDDQESSMLDK
jgi:hypothetical protein